MEETTVGRPLQPPTKNPGTVAHPNPEERPAVNENHTKTLNQELGKVVKKLCDSEFSFTTQRKVLNLPSAESKTFRHALATGARMYAVGSDSNNFEEEGSHQNFQEEKRWTRSLPMPGSLEDP